MAHNGRVARQHADKFRLRAVRLSVTLAAARERRAREGGGMEACVAAGQTGQTGQTGRLPCPPMPSRLATTAMTTTTVSARRDEGGSEIFRCSSRARQGSVVWASLLGAAGCWYWCWLYDHHYDHHHTTTTTASRLCPWGVPSPSWSRSISRRPGARHGATRDDSQGQADHQL